MRMKPYLVLSLILNAALLVKIFGFPGIIEDRIVHTETVTEIDSSWVVRALTAEEQAANLEDVIRSFKPKMVLVSDIKNTKVRDLLSSTTVDSSVIRVVRDTVRMVQEINIDFETSRGRDSVQVFADLYPSVSTVLWRAVWKPDYTQVVTERVTETNTVLKRLTWGVQAGAGMSTAGPAAWIGLGANFNLGGL